MWWIDLDDECPITLEPLSELPYPPFALTEVLAAAAGGKDDGRHKEGRRRDDEGRCRHHYFDGLALAAFVVCRGAFVNPLTRVPLTYYDCVRLDDYLREHVYHRRGGGNSDDHASSLVGVDGRTVISVREAFALRDSIKVKVDGGRGRGTDDARRRLLRAEALRDEAAVALRGLFIFGHDRSRGGGDGDDKRALQGSRSPTSRTLPGGFDLYSRRPASNSGVGGLYRVVDDDDAAFEAADVVAWRQVQEEFPYLAGDGMPRRRQLDDVPDGHILEAVRRIADLTLVEERERSEILEGMRRRYSLEASERKRNRAAARERARREANDSLTRKKEEECIMVCARREIDDWRERQWDEWDRVASSTVHESNSRVTDDSTATTEPPPGITEPDHSDGSEFASHDAGSSAEDRDDKAAAKKKAKRRKAKERESERKRLEKSEIDKKERAEALLRKKEASANKCGACGVGILGCGFEKFGVHFCSTACARSGSSSLR